jgi:hypothetical protein
MGSNGNPSFWLRFSSQFLPCLAAGIDAIGWRVCVTLYASRERQYMLWFIVLEIGGFGKRGFQDEVFFTL